jgi:cob(I)alamin adenosyltransferase
MKIYTKTGDKGTTALIGGTRVPKHHLRIEAYGTADELNSVIGMLRDHLVTHPSHDLLKEIQDRLFIIGSMLASDPLKSKMKIPKLTPADVEMLEKEIDNMNETLPELKTFILPGGHPSSSWCHIARCVCRRCERLVTHLSDTEPVAEQVLIYLNRLSDYLFVLARFVMFEKGISETPWKPRD